MTVEELIMKLREMPKDAIVCVLDYGNYYRTDYHTWFDNTDGTVNIDFD